MWSGGFIFVVYLIAIQLVTSSCISPNITIGQPVLCHGYIAPCGGDYRGSGWETIHTRQIVSDHPGVGIVIRQWGYEFDGRYPEYLVLSGENPQLMDMYELGVYCATHKRPCPRTYNSHGDELPIVDL